MTKDTFSKLLVAAFIAIICIGASGATEDTIAVTDDIGRQVSVTGIPERIISLSPSNTEMLFALGLQDKLVGVTKYCNYPPAVQELKDSGKLTVVGGYVDPDVETILSLSPDLVLASKIHGSDAVSIMEKKNTPAFVADSNNLSQIFDTIKRIGKITGKEAEATALTEQMQSRVNAVSEKVSPLAKKRVFYVLWHDPVQTAGLGTFEDELIEKAGGINIFHNLSGYAQVDPEAIAVENPEVIIACTGMGEGADMPYQWAKTEPGLNLTDARKNECIYQAEGDVITRAGPRIVEGLEMFARFIHPEAF